VAASHHHGGADVNVATDMIANPVTDQSKDKAYACACASRRTAR
jgi:hypothetical protein